MHSEDEKVYTDERVALYMELIRVANEYTGHVFSIDLDRSMLFHTTYEYGDGLMLISAHNKKGAIELCSSYRGASPIPDEPYGHICELFDRMISFCLDEYGGSFIIYGSPISFDPDLFWKYSESFGYILTGFIDSFEDTVDAVCEVLEDSDPSEGPSDKDPLGKVKLIEQGIADLFDHGYQPDLTRANVYAALDKLLRDPIWVELPPDIILDDIRPIIVLLDQLYTDDDQLVMLDILKVVSAINTPENAFMILGAKELVPEGFEYRCFVELYTVIRHRIRTKAVALRMVEDY